VRPQTREGIRYCLTVFLAVRVGLFVLGLAAVALIPPLGPVSVPGWPAQPLPDPGWHNVFTSFERMDALWFLRIASDGYRSGDGSAAFFPLYPVAIRVVSWAIGGHPLISVVREEVRDLHDLPAQYGPGRRNSFVVEREGQSVDV